MEPALRHLLEHLNPWLSAPHLLAEERRRRLPDPFVPRVAAPAAREALADPRRAHLVVGPRQAGKSTLLWSLVEPDEDLLFVNCEEPLVRSWCRSPALVARDLQDWLPAGGLLFLEEAQWLKDTGLFVKGLVDLRAGWRIAVTGSASFHLLDQTRESLAGRATYHHVWPLSLAEATQDVSGRPPAARRSRLAAALNRQLRFGGYPEAWTAPDPAPVLHLLVRAFLLRDASDRFRIQRPDAFRLLLRLAARQVGDLVNLASWARILGVSASTVAEYLGLLEETHVVRLLRPFVGGRRAELTSAPKLFFLDNGLRNAVAGGFERLDVRTDIGKLLESWVFGELHKRFPEPGAVRYWRTRNGAEVDFVLGPPDEARIGIEVKATERARPRLTRSARSFLEAYEPAELWLVSRAEPHEETPGRTRLRWIPAELLPDAIADLPDP